MRFWKCYLLSLLTCVGIASAQNCQLVVPPRPLTASGLATPYLLQFNSTSTQGCQANNNNNLAFVHGVIVDTVTAQVRVYNPLVITAGTLPAIQPIAPELGSNSVVAIWFGYNGGILTLVNTPGTNSTNDGNCVTGLTNTATGAVDAFGQFAYCNAPAWFNAAYNLIAAGKLVIPPLGNAVDGQVCPNVRAWDAVDQDQSDNVPTTYLLDGKTQSMAQNTAANRAALIQPQVMGNPSDNVLVTNFLMPNVGCKKSVWMVPDLADSGALTTALPLDEIQASAFMTFPQALCPLNHAFTMAGGTNFSQPKTNLYRIGVNQPTVQVTATGVMTGQASPSAYCMNLNRIGGPRLAGFKAQYSAAPSPANDGNTLYSFLVNRFAGSNVNLGCAALIGQSNVFSKF
eukprot:TRINITY_DN2800_c0_g1_i1.p1 TRINITY_DN2800_c0_g1~~TRINITY_DN2800_c0_g1_i1.p1  ORF type:complete len:400 (+),score=66.08 TRINITY_DN2800_c0_g1_i1:97-1296(+)